MCNSKSIAASAIREIKHEAGGQEANKARGEAECFISLKATRQVLYKQGDAFTGLKNFDVLVSLALDS